MGNGENLNSMEWGDNPNDKFENTDSYVYDKDDVTESEARDYEKRLDAIGKREMYGAESNVDRLLVDLTWRGSGDTPREKYNREHRKVEVDRLRLLSEAQLLNDYDYRKDKEDIPESKFLRHLADTCNRGHYRVVDTVPLSESELEHFNSTAGNFTKYLSTESNRERTFTNYVKSLLRMCRSAYGKDSRAMMYLCDDLNQMLAPHKDTVGNPVDNKSKIIDRLIERKLNAAQKIAMGKIIAPPPSGRFLIGFNGILDLPDGIENRTVKELVDEGVPSLYGYGE